MNTITIQVENKSTLESLKKVLKAMNGVVILPNKRNKKRGLENVVTATQHWDT